MWTDKPIQLSESFTLEPIQLIQTRDFDHSVQAIHQQKTTDQKSHSFSRSESELRSGFTSLLIQNETSECVSQTFFLISIFLFLLNSTKHQTINTVQL